MKVRAKLTLRNEAAIAARTKLGLSQAAVARAAGISVSVVNSLECLQFDRVPERHILKLAIFLEVPPDELVPPELRRKALKSRHEVVQDIPTIALLEAGMHPVMLAAPADAPVHEAEMVDAINTALGMLNHNERKVVRLIWGLGPDRRQHTYGEAAQLIGLGRARVHTIHQNAMRKLQHPSRRRVVASFDPGADP